MSNVFVKGGVLEYPVGCSYPSVWALRGHSGDACEHTLPRNQYPNAGQNAASGPDTLAPQNSLY